jgi:MFS family permease
MALLVLWAFLGYGMTTILVYGSIFDNQRNWIKKHSNFFGTLIGCMMCTSTWVGFFLSITLGGLTVKYLDINPWVSVFFDGMFTCGIVWAINGIVEFFEESRIK